MSTPNPTIQNANTVPTISHMNERCINFIKSGEKINDIETILRELVENSIDAGATKIDIKIAKFGSDYIEVEDNGSGIEHDNLEHIAKRHYTSKINVDDKDLTQYHEHLTTFGFRGEALFCLCNIANIIISTRSANSPTGTKITFNNQGTLCKKEHVPRQVGTTVIVKNLFHSLPVRRKELESCGKRQYDKIVRLIQENVIARPHIKFTLNKTHKLQVIKDFTYGGSSLENTIIAIFGVKLFETLIPLDKSATPEIFEESGSQQEVCIEDDDLDEDVTKVKKESGENESIEVILEPISTQFMGSQFYKKRRKCSSVRQVEFKVHGYISKLYNGRHSTDGQFLFINQKPCDVPRVARLINEIYRNYTPSQTPFYCIFVQVQNWAADFNVPRKRAVIINEENKLCDMIKKILDTLYSPTEPSGVDCMNPCASFKMDLVSYYTQEQPNGQPCQTDQANQSNRSNKSDQPSLVEEKDRTSKRDADVLGEPDISEKIPLKRANNNDDPISRFKEIRDPFDKNYRRSNGTSRVPLPSRVLAIEYFKVQFNQSIIVDGDKLSLQVDYMKDLAGCLARERAHRAFHSDSKQYSYAIDPDFSKVSEDQLKINLSCQSFESMEIIGQFNKGFIITKFNDHLFIVDQHASDERFNFEDQLDKYPLDSQPMVLPKPLLLTISQENAIINNLNEFERRGFKFIVDETKLPGYRVLLSSTSICKGLGLDVHLDKNDIEELINVVTNTPNLVHCYTLEKVKNLAATRACRKSVMIGDSLSTPMMKNIVAKMSTLKNPWICAHGRPTIRHLMDVQWMYKPIRRPKWIENMNINTCET